MHHMADMLNVIITKLQAWKKFDHSVFGKTQSQEAESMRVKKNKQEAMNGVLKLRS